VFRVDGFDGLIGFLDKVGPDAFVGLSSVPGTTLGGTENFHDLQKVICSIYIFSFKIHHVFLPPMSENPVPMQKSKIPSYFTRFSLALQVVFQFFVPREGESALPGAK